MAQWNLDALRQNMACMQQETGLIRDSMAENIAWKRAEEMTAVDERRIGEILRFVGLSDLSAETAYERLAQLSMGGRQRVGFAQCLFKDAKLWIPDEPGVALKKGACIQLIHAVNALAGAVILSSHDAEGIEGDCARRSICVQINPF